jgi:hypothetical protein
MKFEIKIQELEIQEKKVYYIKFNDSYLYMGYNLKGERTFKLRDDNLIISSDYHFFDTLEDAQWVADTLFASLNNIKGMTFHK